MFKLVCGAGNEDVEHVKRLVYVYAKAGAAIFDISARKDILEAAKNAITLSGTENKHICVSVGINGDKHISKAKINMSKCIKCAACYRVCPYDAIYSSIIIDEKKCLGCQKCFDKCPTQAITMEYKSINTKEILPYMVQNGADILELHIIGNDEADLQSKWKIINECNPEFVSICVDRENFGNREVIERIKDMIKNRAPYKTIIQADGIPMSGGSDDYKTTLQAVAMAEIIQNAELPVHIMLSGGTNSKTAELAKLCGVKYWGIAIGSWARKIVNEYINHENFWNNTEIQNRAIQKASELVLSVE